MVKRKSNEEYDDYFVRLFEHKNEYELNCNDIAELLNFETGNTFSESAYRKEFASFNRGRVYEQRKMFNGVATRILTVSDLHVPFQIPIESFKDYVGVIDILVLNGDLVDMREISRFSKCYRQSPMDEIIACRQYIISLIEYLQPKRVIITYGNHEIRFQNYLSKNLDTDIIELMPSTPLELIFNDGFRHYDKQQHSKVWYEPIKDIFDDISIEYNGEWWVKVGKTIFAHPLAFSSGILKTTEKAVNYFYRVTSDFDCVVLAHTHKLGFYPEGDVYLFEQGCCCKTEAMNYTDGKLTFPQQKGALYLAQDKNGALLYDKSKLITF